MTKKMILVPCAVIEQGGKILAAQRNVDMSLPLQWEFPGGKVDEGETEIEALHREILEELSVEISVGERLEPTYREDPNRIICLIPYLCQLVTTDIVLTEHAQYQWIDIENIYTLDWAVADLGVIKTFLALQTA